MALMPSKSAPDYEKQMEAWKKDNSRWAGDDMNKGMPPKQPPQQGQRIGLPPQPSQQVKR